MNLFTNGNRLTDVEKKLNGYQGDSGCEVSGEVGTDIYTLLGEK